MRIIHVKELLTEEDFIFPLHRGKVGYLPFGFRIITWALAHCRLRESVIKAKSNTEQEYDHYWREFGGWASINTIESLSSLLELGFYGAKVIQNLQSILFLALWFSSKESEKDKSYVIYCLYQSLEKFV